jgi:hypothetical protein
VKDEEGEERAMYRVVFVNVGARKVGWLTEYWREISKKWVLATSVRQSV